MNRIFEETRLLSADDVAEVLGIKKSTIKKWVSQKRIPYVKFNCIGGGQKAVVRFNGKRLNQWIDEMSVEPEDESEKMKKPAKLKRASNTTIARFNRFAAEM
jgi:excisionase family DNA binding protein